MPSRTAVDQQLIATMFEKLGSGREVARQLGIHENTVYTTLARRRGTCVDCGDPVTSRIYCVDCATHRNERRKQRRAEHRRLGICVECDELRSPLSRIHCEAHRIYALDRNTEWQLRQREVKRGQPSGGLTNERQRERRVRENQGEAGLFVWRMAGGCCELCGVGHKEKTIHVHHLDRDPSHNSVDNLACLCFLCHQLVHHLTEHVEPRKVVRWIKKRYPGILSG